MPRRRALTEAQLEDLLALPTAEADLIQHWTLGRDDIAAVLSGGRAVRFAEDVRTVAGWFSATAS